MPPKKRVKMLPGQQTIAGRHIGQNSKVVSIGLIVQIIELSIEIYI